MHLLVLNHHPKKRKESVVINALGRKISMCNGSVSNNHSKKFFIENSNASK